MDDLDEALFASNTSVTDEDYWTDEALEQGSKCFDNNPKKLTRAVFDELIQTLENPLTKTLKSDLFNIERAKKIHTSYIKRDLSNAKDVGNASAEQRKIFEKAYGILPLDTYNTEVAKHKQQDPSLLSTSLYIIDAVRFAGRFERVEIVGDGSAMSSQDFINAFSVDKSNTFYSVTQINEEFSYINACFSMTLNSLREIDITLQKSTAAGGYVFLVATLDIPNIVSAFGEMCCLGGSVCILRSTIPARITDTNITIHSGYSSFYGPQTHRHGPASVRVMSSNPFNTQSMSHHWISTIMTSNINKCYMKINTIKGYVRGIIKNA